MRDVFSVCRLSGDDTLSFCCGLRSLTKDSYVCLASSRWRCNSLALLSFSFELAVYSLILLFFIIVMKIDPCGLFGKNTNTKYQATTGQDSREKRCHRYTKREPLVELTFPEECRHVSRTVRWIHMHRMDRRSRCHSLSTGDSHTGWLNFPAQVSQAAHMGHQQH
jgi:hypothetical protein